ncbi:FolC bifunctional protein [Acidothermus cellulolyticus 11B]|uniref:Dihydrofolate synthase/folylpolyglutamate synthase n=1 Tax=Acidothermus cellulolyticus (strain ATCC 43068 / DSM 8971 / 11B) TaxID=351607 RepID=A0LSV5_ACIC1|nr:folylpolyglutamate synthase/dihydrofolate synthase family protein [Acidothermus cellulolyticus]ABK52515.1 FolC bifunctional protein [Acidothermus cellulolyticus 11B]
MAGAADLARVEKELLARWPESRIEWKLERMTALMELLGDPQLAYPSIHIAGTNGKTSTARIIDALLRALNLRTGCYTSPHLESITERILLDGEPISDEVFVATYDELTPYFELVDARFPTRLSFFEAVTGMAFAAFAAAPVDVAVVEVGMGGRLDATNIIHAPVAVITPIDLDHQAHLGSTIAAIAGEKAGIIKSDQTVVVAAQHDAAAQVLRRRAEEVGARLVTEGVDFAVTERKPAVGGQLVTIRGVRGEYPELFLPLHGAHQAGNAAVSLAAVETFLSPEHALDIDLLRDAFAGVRSPGRLEIVRTKPTVLVDASHNPAGARVTAATLASEFAFERLIGVIGTLADKDVPGILTAFAPVLSEVIVTRSSSHRAIDPVDLATQAEAVFGPEKVTLVPRLDEALQVALRRAAEADAGGLGSGVGVLVTGSVVTAGEARRLLRQR